MSGQRVTDEMVCQLIGSVLGKSVAKRGVTPQMRLRGDLGVDSVGLMSIALVLEEKAQVDVFGHVQELIDAELVSDIIKVVRES